MADGTKFVKFKLL